MLMKTAITFIKQLTLKIKMEANVKTQDFHCLWSDFIKTCVDNDKLYYYKTDIKDAYGSILHVSLL